MTLKLKFQVRSQRCQIVLKWNVCVMDYERYTRTVMRAGDPMERDYVVIPVDERVQKSRRSVDEEQLWGWRTGFSQRLDRLIHRHFSPSAAKYAREQNLPALIYYASGIFVFYLGYGFVQEIINRGDYDGERFTFPQALVFFQCVVNAIFAKLMTSHVTKPGEDSTPTFLYASCSVCYMGAMVASNQALQYINYPTQVLGKSCKPIPVMILGVLLAKKRYPLAKYLCVLMIVAGVASFMYKDKKGTVTDDSSFGYGEILLIVSLILDGLTGVTQENMRAKHTTNQHHMMYNVNMWSTVFLTLALAVNGQGVACASFIYKHPQVISHLAMFSITSAFGQHFIFLTVVHFGPLTCSIITTTRKFFTILGSVIIFQNPLTVAQWIGAMLVFSGLALDARYGRAIKTPQAAKAES